jgi:hypothetical protein
MMITARDTHCGWCGDEFDAEDKSTDTTFGDVHTTHIDKGELPVSDDELGDPDAAYDRLCDAAYGI